MKLVLSLLLLGASARAFAQSNIDQDDKFCWGENIGWINWRDAERGADGVAVGATFLSGFAWAENVGWIHLGSGKPARGDRYQNVTGADFGVNIDENCDLHGYAWGENIGWINFDTRDRGAQRARIDCQTRRFRGYAWGENVGWLNLDDRAWFVAFESLPSCCAPDCPPPGAVACEGVEVTGPPEGGPGSYVVRVTAAVPAGAEALYVYRAVNTETGDRVVSEAVPSGLARIDLAPGTWILSVSVGTELGCPFTECAPVEVVVRCLEEPDRVQISGPDRAGVGAVVGLTAQFDGADGGAVTYDWEVIAGAGTIAGGAATSSVELTSAVGGEVTVRVRSGDGVCDDDAEAVHTIVFRDCPVEGSVSCDRVEVVEVDAPAGNAPGRYAVTVSATVPAGEEALYFYRVENPITGQTNEFGPLPDNEVNITLPAGTWNLFVSVGTSGECPFAACASRRIEVAEAPVGLGPFVRGDCNADQRIDVNDALCVLDSLYSDRAAPACIAAADINGDGVIDTSDAIYLLLFGFAGGDAPPAPFPGCGVSELAGDQGLGCETGPGYCR